MKDMGEASVILGVKVIRKEDNIVLSQSNTLRNFLESLAIMILN